MQYPDEISKCEDEGLSAFHFGIDANKYIYMACMYLYSKQLEPTPVAIYEVLPDARTREKVDEMGGLNYLVNLTETKARKNNLPIFIEKILQAFTRRDIIAACDEVKAKMQSDESNVLNPAELVMTLEKKVTDMNVGKKASSDLYKMGDNTDAVLAERAESPSEIPGLRIGWPKVDKITNGGQAGDLIFVAARSKVGKSVTLTNWATKLGVIDQLPILYIDTEMTSREAEDRVLANLSGVLHSEIVSGLYMLDTENGKSDDKIRKLKKAKEQLNAGNLYHIYMPGFTMEKVVAITKQFQMKFGIVALFFDYLKPPSDSASSMKTIAEWQMLGYLATSLKDLAGILKIPIYSAVQENRSALDSKKGAGAISGSDRILQLASKLMFLYDKDDEDIERDGIDCGNQLIQIEFQRNGESKCKPIPIMFHKQIVRQIEV